MNVSSCCWSPFYANECVFSRNEQQKVYISHTKQIKRNFHNCIEMKYNLDVIKCYVILCFVRTSSLADIQALDLLQHK